MNSQNNGKLPEHPEPFWRTSVEFPSFPSLTEDLEVDVIVVGAGITGITSAYLLANEGLKVAIIEADKVLNGTTGHTTAKITAQHDLIYDEFIHNMGRNTARMYYEANIEALDFIRKTVEEQQIDCDLTTEDAYIYSVSEKYARKIEKEAQAYEILHIDGGLVDSIPFDIDNVQNVLVMRNQAQFHVTKYLVHLIDLFTKKGGQIFEDTVAVNIETGDRPVVLTREEKRITREACT